MRSYYAYLQVSSDARDLVDQRSCLLDYASRHGYAPLITVEDTASRSLPWAERFIGRLITEHAGRGDIVLTDEVTRLARSPQEVFTLLEVAAARGISLIVTQAELVLDAGLTGAELFGFAARIQTVFIRARTREGLQRAAGDGRRGGRRAGSTGRLKLDPRKAEVAALYELGVSTPKLAKRFAVTEKTMRKFLARHFPKSSN